MSRAASAAARPVAPPRRVGGVRKVVVILLIQGLILLGVLEIAGRIADPLGISYYPETAAYLDTLIVGGEIGYRNAPNLQGRFWGVDVKTNALGLRDRDIEPRAGTDEYRVMLLGDSWTFGLGVAYEDTIPLLLEQRLNEAYDGTRFRALNMGVPSYNSEQERIQLDELGPDLDPDLVILMFASNDIEPKMWVLDKRKNWFVNVAQRSYAACLLVVLGRKLRAALGSRSELISTSAYEPGNPRWEAIADSLTRIRHTLAERDVPLVVVSYLGDDDPALPLLEGLGAGAGFPVVNLRPHEDPRWADVPPLALQNSITDSHPNAAGTRVEAILIHEALERLGLMPPRLGAVSPDPS